MAGVHLAVQRERVRAPGGSEEIELTLQRAAKEWSHEEVARV